MVSKMALGGIWAYQNFLSRRKGFRCAYSVLHGGTGCSGYAKFAIRDHGLWGALPEIRRRFRDCRAAYQQLRENCVCNQAAGEDDEKKRKKSRKRKSGEPSCCSACACEGASLPLYCGGSAARGGSSKVLDFNPCDGDGCGLDCGGMDCVSCDCCSGCSCG